jgi:hypothetical protein
LKGGACGGFASGGAATGGSSAQGTVMPLAYGGDKQPVF